MGHFALAFVGGLLGSSHCLGMCGGFALLVGGAAPSIASNVTRQLLYTAGRVFTYSIAGSAIGFVGLTLTRDLPAVVNAQALLALLAGALLLFQGLLATGVVRRRPVTPSRSPCLAGGFLGTFLRGRSRFDAFLAGVFTAFLPCGLVYAYLALAASTGHLWAGGATMTAFGLGTAPLMVLAGSGASLLSYERRGRLLRLAAWFVVLTGVLSLARGAAILMAPADQPAACPFCHPESPIDHDSHGH